jgi:hypothetical protein
MILQALIQSNEIRIFYTAKKENTIMKKILFLSVILSLFLVSGAFAAASWFDDFESYADQSALDAVWSAADAKANGILDNANHFIGTQSMRCERYPTEIRATRSFGEESEGMVNIWVYDDGADIKSFDIALKNATNYVGLGLRDNQVGVDTEYTCNKDGAVANTGITRFQGWHLFQFNSNAAAGTETGSGLPFVIGTEMVIDAQRFTGNVYATLTKVTDLIIYTNFGNATDENKVWVDSVEWSAIAGWGVPRQARTGNISNEFQPPVGLTEWDVLAGSNTELTNAPDGGDPANLHLDAFDPDGGLKGFYYKGSWIVPRTAYYVFECPFMNGPTWDEHNPWPSLTFKVGDAEFNEGSTTTGVDWAYVAAPGDLNWYYRTKAPLIGGDTINIEVTGDPLSTLPSCFVRIYRCELLYARDYTPPPPPTDVQGAWSLYE